MFLRRFLQRARDEGYIYYLMEAFDQPWKARYEGAVGAYWGVYDVDREPKFAFVEPIVRIPQWQTLAAISVVLAIDAARAALRAQPHARRARPQPAGDRRLRRDRRRGVDHLRLFAAVPHAAQRADRRTADPRHVRRDRGAASPKRTSGPRRTGSNRAAGLSCSLLRPARALPKVSIHVPAYNEPPEMLIETLDALARLDYPDYEVIVVDNNTQGRSGVAAGRAALRAARRTLPLLPRRSAAGLQGRRAQLRAGAHARRTRRSSPSSTATTRSSPRWLRDLVPGFAEPKIAIVQAPQDYRDGGENAFKAMCYAEYRGFFHIGMITRNERNAIIQHGTMTLVRRAGAGSRSAAGRSGASPRMPSSACACSSTATKRNTCRAATAAA